jgi:5-methylcytosine-specific restriction endonuclease McrA
VTLDALRAEATTVARGCPKTALSRRCAGVLLRAAASSPPGALPARSRHHARSRASQETAETHDRVFRMDTARELTKRLADLLRNERQALADFIVALADFDRRRRYEELGHASLFAFLHRELGLSKGAAYYRMTAARLVQAFPEIVEPLRDGRLCMTSVVELSKAITPENRQEVLPRYFHLSKDEAKAVTAELRPAEIVPTRSVVTTVRAPALALRASTAEPKRDARVGTTEVHPANLDLPVAPAKPAARDVVEPLTKDLSRLHITVPPRVVEKIAAARDALSHRMPGASDAEVLEAALDALLAKSAKRKGASDKPQTTPRPAKPGYIPAHVKRAVWKRDGGRCQWPVSDGGVCGSTYQVEFDHRKARALGGGAAVEDIRLLCKSHNLESARETFGDEWMARFTRARRRRTRETEPGGTDSRSGPP